MVDLVHSHKSRRELKHVVSERDDNELGVLGTLLDVVGNDRDLHVALVTCISRTIEAKCHGDSKECHWTGCSRVSRAKTARGRGILTFLKSKAASISSMTYRGVGL